MALLPHRPPFLLLDEVVELEPGVRCVARARCATTTSGSPGTSPATRSCPACSSSRRSPRRAPSRRGAAQDDASGKLGALRRHRQGALQARRASPATRCASRPRSSPCTGRSGAPRSRPRSRASWPAAASSCSPSSTPQPSRPARPSCDRRCDAAWSCAAPRISALGRARARSACSPTTRSRSSSTRRTSGSRHAHRHPRAPHRARRRGGERPGRGRRPPLPRVGRLRPAGRSTWSSSTTISPDNHAGHGVDRRRQDRRHQAPAPSTSRPAAPASSTASPSPRRSSRPASTSNVLVIGAEVLSKMLDWEDRTTCVLFGDGAGAVLVQPTDNGSIFSFDLGNDGSGAAYLNVPAGGSRMPASHETVREHEHAMQMTGSEVFKFATRTVVGLVREGARRRRARASRTSTCSCRTRPTSASSSRRRGGWASREEQVFANLDRYGNTSCASIPICLHEASAERPPQEGRHAAHGRLRRRAHLGLVPHQVGAVGLSPRWRTSSLVFPARGRRPSAWAATSAPPSPRCATPTPRPGGARLRPRAALLRRARRSSSRAPTSRSRRCWPTSVGIFRILRPTRPALRRRLRPQPRRVLGAGGDAARCRSTRRCAWCGGAARPCWRAADGQPRRHGGRHRPGRRRRSRSSAPSVGRRLAGQLQLPRPGRGERHEGGSGATLAGKAKAAGARGCIPLAVSGAFHSPLMEPALEPLRAAAASAPSGARRTRAFFSVCSVGVRDRRLRRAAAAAARLAGALHAVRERSVRGRV